MTRIVRRVSIILVAQLAILWGLTGVVHAGDGKAWVEVSTQSVARAKLGVLLLPVSIRCTVPNSAVSQVAEVYVGATQRAGTPHEVSGQVYRSGFRCDGTKRTKVIAITPGTEAGFVRGRVAVSIDANACWWPPGESQSTCVTDSLARTVWVKYGGALPAAVTGGTFPLAVSSGGHVRGGVAGVRVRYRCSMPEAADDLIGEITVNLRQQAVPRAAAVGYATLTDLTCDGLTQRVRVAVSSETARAFGPGPSVARVEGYAAWFDVDTGDEGWVDGFVDAAVVWLSSR